MPPPHPGGVVLQDLRDVEIVTRYATPVIRRIALAATLPAVLVAGFSLTASAAAMSHGLKLVRDPAR